MFFKSVIFLPVSNFLMSNFNGFCMALEYVRNEEFEIFYVSGFQNTVFYDTILLNVIGCPD